MQWGLEASEETWDILEGFTEGQTHTNWPKHGGKTVWAHPIDVHYQCMVCVTEALKFNPKPRYRMFMMLQPEAYWYRKGTERERARCWCN